MGNLLFSPNGRITPDEFMKGAYVLIAIGIILGLLPLVSMSLSMIFSLLGLVTLWCWIVLFIKRFHDGGKVGWMCLLPILAFIVSSFIIGGIVTGMVGGTAMSEQAIQDAAQSGDLSAVMDATSGLARKTAIPSAIAGAVVSFAIAYVTNMLIKRDGDNQYGPA